MQPQLIEKNAERSAESGDDLAQGKQHLIGLTRSELVDAFTAYGLKRMHAGQVWQWMYKRGATDFNDMTNIAKPTRELLDTHCVIARNAVAKDALSFDGTRKWLVSFADESQVETVYIPEEDRGTLCISSQVGCTLSCTFCHTGTQRLVRNLTARDIVMQVMMAKDHLGDWLPLESRDKTVTSPNAALRNESSSQVRPHRHEVREGELQSKRERRDALPVSAANHAIDKSAANHVIDKSTEKRSITNIVFMGMGEPLMNYDHVVRAIELLSDNEGLALSRRKITVSTSGVVPLIEKLGHDAGCSLAISLHATTNELRNEIVPINRKYPIEQLLQACRNYPELSNARRIMFEYVMLKDVNDSDEDARRLITLLQGIPAKVNLIPFNPWPGALYQCSSNNRIHAFRRILQQAGITTPIRKTRGEDIMAACGQLKSASELKKGQKVKLK
jgi:23S rRNA (adenine2503-C2)-methyltransferase